MNLTLIEYVLKRLKQVGGTDIFGVPGDFAFPINDAVYIDQDLRWVCCCNELNAAYAADGYARVKGLAVIGTTHGVGRIPLAVRSGWILYRTPAGVSHRGHAQHADQPGTPRCAPHPGQRRIRPV